MGVSSLKGHVLPVYDEEALRTRLNSFCEECIGAIKKHSVKEFQDVANKFQNI